MSSPPAKRAKELIKFHQKQSTRNVQEFNHRPMSLWRDVLSFFTDINESVIDLLKELLLESQMKVCLCIQILMTKDDVSTGGNLFASSYFRSEAVTVFNSADVAPAVASAYSVLGKKVEL